MGEPSMRPQMDARMAAAAALLQGGGYSNQPRGLGEILGNALMAGQQARSQAEQQQMQRQYMQAQMAAMQGKNSPIGDVDPSKFTPESVAAFRASGGADYSKLVPVAPKTDTPAALLEYQKAVEQGFKGTFFDYQAALKRAGASPTNVSVNTEKDLYGGMAGKIADTYVAQFDAATKAPDLIDRAGRVKSLLEASPITGAGADWLLAGSKIAAQLGIDTGNAAADTEALASELAATTLDAIATSGLGSGQGFTDKDRQFLQDARAGRITLERKTIERLADLNEKAAISSIKRWNATAGRLDPQQLRLMGLTQIPLPEVGSRKPGGGALTRNPDGSLTYTPGAK